MENKSTKQYAGTSLKAPNRDLKLDAYIPSESLKNAVNMMILLQKRPLLIMGEPGCGKTRLAEAVAYDLYGKDYKKHYFEWHIKSTTKAKEGLYRYDALRRLNDAQINGRETGKVDIDNMKLDAKNSYITSGSLTKAFKASKQGQPAIVLIDEIDKADPDFANDLLHELDKYELSIEETGEAIPPPEMPPLVFITSNGEKELPAAFLRRCLFHYIEFPKEALLKQILSSHFSDASESYVQKAIDTFLDIRKQLEKKSAGNEKKVSTSELIDWFALIENVNEARKNGAKNIQALVEQLDEWLKNEGTDPKIPFFQVLLKNLEARDIFKQRIDHE